jgi:hypothetical protein
MMHPLTPPPPLALLHGEPCDDNHDRTQHALPASLLLKQANTKRTSAPLATLLYNGSYSATAAAASFHVAFLASLAFRTDLRRETFHDRVKALQQSLSRRHIVRLEADAPNQQAGGLRRGHALERPAI